MLRCYEPAHIAGVSKTAYVPATPRCLQWRRDLQRDQHEQRPAGSGSAGSASPACSSSSRRSPRALGDRSRASSSTASRREATHRRPARRASPCARRGRRRRPRRHDGLRRRGPGCRQARSRAPRRPAQRRDRCRERRRRVRRRQRLALPGLPGAAPPARRSRSTARRRRQPAGWPRPTRPPHVSGDAVDIGPSDAAAWLSDARRRVRALPDLRQRALALRAAPGGHRSRLPAHVRRPDPRPKDAAVTTRRARWPPSPWSP